MNIFELGALGDILSSFGVLASLIYLSIQVRQHTAQQAKLEIETRSAAVNASALALRENRIGVYQDGEFAKIYHRGLSAPDQLNEIEYLRFRIHMQNVLDGLWDIHSRTVGAGNSEEIWNTLGKKGIERMVSTPGGRKVWEQMSIAYPIEFKQAVDEILVQT